VTVTRGDQRVGPRSFRYNLTPPRRCKRAISAQRREVQSPGRRLILDHPLVLNDFDPFTSTRSLLLLRNACFKRKQEHFSL